MRKKNQIDSIGISLLIILCISWGFQLSIIKITAPQISPVMQAGIRSMIAMIALFLWTLLKKQKVFKKDGSFWWGTFLGILFTLEFVFIYLGLGYTNASRAVIFLYTTPFLIAIGTHFFLPEEKLISTQYLGLIIAFIGILVAFYESLGMPTKTTLFGDLMIFLGAVFWSATVIVVKATPLANITANKSLLYQLAVSALLLPLASIILNEPGINSINTSTVISLIYQGIWVAFITYLIWYWLILKYPAPQVSSFTFFTPIFGVLAGWMLLKESLSIELLIAMFLIALGIWFVNKDDKAIKR